MNTIKPIFLISVCTALLCACGNKGPLYLPDEETTVEQSSAEDEKAKKEDEKKDNPASR